MQSHSAGVASERAAAWRDTKATVRPSGARKVLRAIAIAAAAVLLAACNGHDDDDSQAQQAALVEQGRQTFRYDTFGDEAQWTDTLRMHEVISEAVDPVTALSGRTKGRFAGVSPCKWGRECDGDNRVPQFGAVECAADCERGACRPATSERAVWGNVVPLWVGCGWPLGASHFREPVAVAGPFFAFADDDQSGFGRRARRHAGRTYSSRSSTHSTARCAG